MIRGGHLESMGNPSKNNFWKDYHSQTIIATPTTATKEPIKYLNFISSPRK